MPPSLAPQKKQCIILSVINLKIISDVINALNNKDEAALAGLLFYEDGSSKAHVYREIFDAINITQEIREPEHLNMLQDIQKNPLHVNLKKTINDRHSAYEPLEKQGALDEKYLSYYIKDLLEYFKQNITTLSFDKFEKNLETFSLDETKKYYKELYSIYISFTQGRQYAANLLQNIIQ